MKTVYSVSKAIGQVVSAIRAEMSRHIDLWGEQSHPDGTSTLYNTEVRTWKDINNSAAEHGDLTWTGILLEEVYEALAETDPALLRVELLQVAAVAGSWVKDLDTRGEQ